MVVIHMARRVFSLLLSAYQRIVSPLLPRACRFYPSCSVYMEQAVLKYGIAKGIVAGLTRIGRCHPWHPGGYDPVN